MLITISLIILIAVGFLLSDPRIDLPSLGFIIVIASALYLLIHVIEWSTAAYDYNLFVAKREAFIYTLSSARQSGNQIELAAIVQDISKWNQDLAEAKYDNSTFLLGDYVDDRIEQLKPIK